MSLVALESGAPRGSDPSMVDHPDVAAASTPLEAEPVRRARRGLSVYLALVVAGSAVLEGLMLRAGGGIGTHGGLVLALMWTPGLASLVTRLALREHPRDVSFGFGGTAGARGLGLALLYPLAVGTLAYGGAWLTGLERFEAPARQVVDHTPAVAFAMRVALMATLGALEGCISALGEELGWRGYMLTRLIDAGVRRPVLTSGLIWGAWHLPLILSGQYASGPSPLLSAAMFLPTVVCGGYIAASVRLASGSVWPAVFFHGAWNAIIQGAFNRYTAGGSSSHGTGIWTGESGILVAAASLLVTYAFVLRQRFALRRTTGAEPGELVRMRDL